MNRRHLLLLSSASILSIVAILSDASPSLAQSVDCVTGNWAQSNFLACATGDSATGTPGATVLLGVDSGSNSGGGQDSFVGYNAGAMAPQSYIGWGGSSSTAVGSDAGYGGANQQTSLGYEAGYLGAGYSTMIGAQAGAELANASASRGTYATYIGYQAGLNTSSSGLILGVDVAESASVNGVIIGTGAGSGTGTYGAWSQSIVAEGYHAAANSGYTNWDVNIGAESGSNVSNIYYVGNNSAGAFSNANTSNGAFQSNGSYSDYVGYGAGENIGASWGSYFGYMSGASSSTAQTPYSNGDGAVFGAEAQAGGGGAQDAAFGAHAGANSFMTINVALGAYAGMNMNNTYTAGGVVAIGYDSLQNASNLEGVAFGYQNSMNSNTNYLTSVGNGNSLADYEWGSTFIGNGSGLNSNWQQSGEISVFGVSAQNATVANSRDTIIIGNGNLTDANTNGTYFIVGNNDAQNLAIGYSQPEIVVGNNSANNNTQGLNVILGNNTENQGASAPGVAAWMTLVGNNISSYAEYSTIIGTNSTADANSLYTTAIGANINAVNTGRSDLTIGAGATNNPNSGTLGGWSAVIGTGAVGQGFTQINNSIISGTTFSGYYGYANGALSIGSATSLMQVQNVAAGQLTNTSDDGVNGSELYDSLNQILNSCTSNCTGGGGSVTVANNATNNTISTAGSVSESANDASLTTQMASYSANGTHVGAGTADMTSYTPPTFQ